MILSLDPSTIHIGWALFDEERGGLLHHGTFATSKGALNSLTPYQQVADWLGDILSQWETISHVVMEEDLPAAKAKGGGHVDRALSRMVGVLIGVCYARGRRPHLIHNQAVKATYSIPNERKEAKLASIAYANLVCQADGVNEVANDHAADAILVGSYFLGLYHQLALCSEPWCDAAYSYRTA